MSVSRINRNDTLCPIVGRPSLFAINVLPTNGEIIKEWLQLQLNEAKPGIIPSRCQIITDISSKLRQLWISASIPIISPEGIRKKLDNLFDLYRDLKKSYKRDNEKPKFQVKADTLRLLFDISVCKCKDFEQCRCPKDRKVPKEEQIFLIDQRNKRKMFIGGIDPKISNRNMKNWMRKESKNAAKSLSIVPETSCSSDSVQTADENIDEVELDSVNDPTFEMQGIAKINNSLRLDAVALASERTGISDRKAAIIASAVLEDVGIISDENPSNITDRKKIERARKKSRSAHLADAQEEIASKNPLGLYFDGKRDSTLKLVKKGVKRVKMTVIEDHYTIVLEPGSQYKAHVTPESSTAKDISSAMYENMGSQMDAIKVIGSDGTNTNVGSKGGVITLLESKLGRNLQWSICLLHFNELPLRKLFQEFGRQDNRPEGFYWRSGKATGKF